MDIDELIERLLAMKSDCGNAKIEVRNKAGEFDEAVSISATSYGMPDAVRFVVFIDT